MDFAKFYGKIAKNVRAHAVSIDGQETTLPFVCEGDPEPPPSIGFSVNVGGGE